MILISVKSTVTIIAGLMVLVAGTAALFFLRNKPLQLSTSTAAVTSAPSPQALKYAARNRNVKFGCEVTVGPFRSDPAYRALSATECDVITPTNVNLFGVIQGTKDRFDFGPSDEMSDFAVANGQKLYLQPLIYAEDEQYVPWLRDLRYEGPDEIRRVMKNHIQTVLTHFTTRYPGLLHAVTVVNEPLESASPFNVRDYSFSSMSADREEHIRLAFQWAREVTPPSVKLCLNEYWIEGNGPVWTSLGWQKKSDRFYELAQRLKVAGTPIDCVGFQMHFDLSGERVSPPPEAEILANINRYKNIGVEVFITEIDGTIKTSDGITAAELAQQAEYFTGAMRACLMSNNCSNYFTWGLVDTYAWSASRFPGLGAPLLFDTALAPKPAYGALVDYLTGVTEGFEADVTPRPTGSNDGAVTVTDCVQVGRFVVGLDTAAAGGEFQRADCAPRATLGDGRLTIADWVQAGRYAAGLDPVVAAGGPTVAAGSLSMPGDSLAPASGQRQAKNGARRTIVRAVIGAEATRSERRVTLKLDGQGAENALSLSLLFNPAEWRFLSARVGADASDAALLVNTIAAKQGRLGLALSLPAGRTFAEGARQFAVLTFALAPGAKAAALALGFGDEPTPREIADPAARPLEASYESRVGKSLVLSSRFAHFQSGFFKMPLSQ